MGARILVLRTIRERLLGPLDGGTMSGAAYDYVLRVVRLKRGTTNQAADISYTALPLGVRGDLELAWKGRHGLSRWMPLEYRLQSETTVPAERLREIARDMLSDIADVWEGVSTELAVVIRHRIQSGGSQLVERANVAKTEERKVRERVARKLGKGARHSRFGITLEGTHGRWPTWEAADRYVRGLLTADDLRAVRVQWERVEWDYYDNTVRSMHVVYADAAHLLDAHPRSASIGSTAWKAVRHTLDPQVAEVVEALSGEWHGTGADLLTAAAEFAEVGA